ncbi:MAG: hypothetical protein DRJ11_05240 [Candidatus Aminicenantes bacterium]|nr:MAG: hypothetical protein DRJ11_05240 [Candidatus Aminicenantes bacterium]HHF42460.1 hypothetical protein [Candidatus Aminicenantes bacterium]
MAYYFTLAFYLLFLPASGLHLTRRLKKEEDFLGAGRNLTTPGLVGTWLATWIGSGDIFSEPDEANWPPFTR